MDYPALVRKSANLHIQGVSRGLICIFSIYVKALVKARQYVSYIYKKNSEYPLMYYSALVLKSANLHNQDGRHGLIYISQIEVNALQTSIFFRSPFWTPSAELSG